MTIQCIGSEIFPHNPVFMFQIYGRKMITHKFLLVSVSVISMTFCAHIGPLSAQKAEKTTALELGNYRLAITDLLEIKVFQEEDLTTSARIANDGTINFPLIGRIKVGGLTPEEATAAIRSALAKDYLVNPQVSVEVSNFSKRRFTVLGQVQKGGTFDFPDQDDLNLLQAIGLAGGYTRIADPKEILVKRRTNGKEEIYKLNARKMASGEQSSAFKILPGDIITVGESWL